MEPSLRLAVARNLADSGARRRLARQVAPPPSEPIAQVPQGGPAAPVREPPEPPAGYAYTRVVKMNTAALPTLVSSRVQPPVPPAWMEPRISRALLPQQADGAGRDWTFAWILRARGVALDRLGDALRPLGAAVLGASGAYVRVRVPASVDSLDAIVALEEVTGLGAVPATRKVDAAFAASARTRPPGEVAPVFITLMTADPAGHWRRALEALGIVVGAWDEDLRAYAANLPYGALDTVTAADFVVAVEPVALVSAAHDTAIPVMGADALRSRSAPSGSFTGTAGHAIPVGIMDTGLNVSHPDIASGRSSICGTNFVPSEDYALWRDLGGFSRARGHGTHVTGTILGAGAVDPLMAGMAPRVPHIRVAKVLATRDGRGSTDNINRAMDYLAAASSCSWNGETHLPVKPLIVNMSLASTGLEFSGRGVGERKLDATVWAHGQLYVVAQANAGVHGVSNYATAKNSLAVGAAADTGSAASFSSHGPTADGRLAPNVVATGVDVFSPRGQDRQSGYVSLSGTSMAAPAVAGAAALLMDAAAHFREQPALSRARIMASAVRPDAFLGAGLTLDNTAGPGKFQNRYGLGLASARLTVLQRDQADGWTSGAALTELAAGQYAYVDIEVPPDASRLDVVMTWDEGPAEAVTESVLNDLDLWVDAGAECGPGACGEHSSLSRVDNVEWVMVERPAAGVHRVKILGERVQGEAPLAAVAWTVIRGPSIPRLRVEPEQTVVRTTAGEPVEIELSVTADGYVAAGSTLHLGARQELFPITAETVREDRATRTDGVRWNGAVSLGEIGAGEKQRVTVSFPVNHSRHVYFTATAWNAIAGTARVDVIVDGDDRLGEAAARPDNDSFAAAATISGASGERAFDLMLASREPGEPEVEKNLAGFATDGESALASAASRSLWYTWRAPDSGTWFFRVNSAADSTRQAGRVNMAVFQGDRITGLEQIGANDSAAIAFNARRNEIYRLRIASTRMNTRPYVLRWEGGHERPPNDDFADREPIEGAEGEVPGSNQGASLEPDEFFGDLAATVWYGWTAPEDGVRSFETADMHVRVFVGDSFRNLRLVSNHGRRWATFPATRGESYRIAVAAPDTETAGSLFELVWGSATSTLADNDAYSDATVIDGRQGNVPGIGLREASVENGEPVETGTQTRWWRWTAPGEGPYTWRLSGLDGPLATLNLFTGDTLRSLRRIASGREVVLDTRPGETYSIAVGTRYDATFRESFNDDLALSWGLTPANDYPAAATALGGSSGSATASLEFATTSADEPVGLAAASSLWWRWAAPATGWYRFRIRKQEALGLYGQPLLAIYRTGAEGEPAFIRSTDHSYVLNGELETAVHAAKGARYLIRAASRAGYAANEITFDWNPASPPEWLRYRGRLADGDPLPAGGSLNLAEARSLAMDDRGRWLFVNGLDRLQVFARDAETGSLAPAGAIAYADANGHDRSWIAQGRLHWNAAHGLLYALYGGGYLAAFRWNGTEPGTVEPCPTLEPFGLSYVSSLDPGQIIATGGFLYVIHHRRMLVYRIDAECEFPLVEILQDRPHEHAASKRVAGLTELRDAALGAGGEYLHVAGDDSLFTFERNPDTGRLRLASTIEYDAVRDEGSPVALPTNLTSIATDASANHLYLFDSGAPNVAVFELRSDRSTPAFVALSEDFHIRSFRFRTHLFWPPRGRSCRAPTILGETVSAACRDGAYLLTWNADDESLRVSDYIGKGIPDRFGSDVPDLGYPHDVLQSPDGLHLYAVSGRLGEAAPAVAAFQTSGLASSSASAVDVPDRNLRAALETALGKRPAEPLTDIDMVGLKRLNAAGGGIVDLKGLEWAHGLTELVLWGNRVADITPLSGLATLERLDLGANRIADVGPLAALDNLTWLNLGGNEITDISALDGLASLKYLGLHGNRIADLPSLQLSELTELSLWGNRIEDLSALADLTTLTRLNLAGNRIGNLEPLAGLTALRWLDLSDNDVADLSPLEGLTELRVLRLAGNRVMDVAPILENGGLGQGALVDLRGNPVDAMSADAVAARGATVLQGTRAEPRTGFFPAATANAPQGFLRVVNRSARDGEIRIVATDDRATKSRPLWLSIDAGETVHLNSSDLETGNANKGLAGGAGTGPGDWRLEFAAGLNIEVLAYLRTADGFVTAMHDTAPVRDGRYHVAIFNPAGNVKQQSRLRLVNPGDNTASIAIAGVDDEGNSPGETVFLTLPPGASRTLSASELEQGGTSLEGALLDGIGKWRLAVESDQPLLVMSLLASPGGHVTNLSTAPELRVAN